MTVPSVDPGTAIAVNYRAAIGYEPLLQYDFVPCPDTNQPVTRQATGCPSAPQATSPTTTTSATPASTPAQTVTSQPPARPAIDLRSTVARLRNGRIALRVACQLTTTCLGRLLILTDAKRPRLISKNALTIPAGKTKTIVARIGRSQRRVLSRRASTPLTVEFDLGKSTPIKEKLTFRR
jgi:hypothetical protein